MVAAFGFAGASAFAMLGLGARALSPQAYTALALTWTAATIYGTVVGITAEQVVTRRVAAGLGAAVPRAAARRLAWCFAGSIVLVPLSLLPGAARLVQPTMWAIAMVAVAAAWVLLAPVRGELSGQHRFVAYAATLLIEAAARAFLAWCAFLDAGNVELLLAAAVAVPLGVSGLLGRLLLKTRPGRPSPSDAAGSAPEQLSMATVALLQQLSLSTAPIWLHWLSEDPGVAGRFVSVLTYMRIPMVLSTGLVTVVLAGASRAYMQQGQLGLVRWIGFGLTSTVVFVGGGVLVLGAISGWALPVLFGPGIGEVAPALLWWAGAGTVAAVGATMLTQIVFGAGHARWAVAALLPATLVTLAGFALVGPSPVALAAVMTVGQVVASVALLLAVAFLRGGRWSA